MRPTHCDVTSAGMVPGTQKEADQTNWDSPKVIHLALDLDYNLGSNVHFSALPVCLHSTSSIAFFFF